LYTLEDDIVEKIQTSRLRYFGHVSDVTTMDLVSPPIHCSARQSRGKQSQRSS